MNRDPAPEVNAAPPAGGLGASLPPLWAPPVRAGLLELTLPLAHAWRGLLLATLVGGAACTGLSLLQPLQYTARASFVVQPAPRPSMSVAAAPFAGLSGLLGSGMSPVDLQLALLQSHTINDRIIERFELQRAWALPLHVQAKQRLARRVNFASGRRDGVISVVVDDEHPQRAAAIANQYVDELRGLLRQFALDEARQRRAFYDAQLARAREALALAQKQLQGSGFDRGALRAEPRAAAEAYGRMQAEVTAAELRLAATRRVRTEGSPEVQQQLGELAALREQLRRMEAPRDEAGGVFVERVRAFRYAEALVEQVSRQAEAARVDEAADPVPMQLLDRAAVPELPSGPRPLLWALAGLVGGFGLMAVWVLLRHRAALAGQDAALQRRLAEIRAALPARRPWLRWPR